jgi:hypothetical protein
MYNFMISATRQIAPSKEIICGGKCPFFDGEFNFSNKEDIVNFVLAFARLASYVAVPIAVIMLIWTGFMVIIGQVKNPLMAIANIFIGLALIVLAYTFTGGFTEILQNGIDIKGFF